MEIDAIAPSSTPDDDELEDWLTKKLQVTEVIMHPLVLLSVADHYHRVARGTRKRVIGVLLGQVSKGAVDATNSFALPFEEDLKNPAVFYLDHNFLENMLAMFRKVNAKERVIGFYSTGPQIRTNDLRIYDIVERYTGNFTNGIKNTSIPSYPAVFSIIDIRPNRTDLPVTSYKVTEEIGSINNKTAASNMNKQIQRVFAHVPTSLGAVEAEEVGVEHLLRDIHDPTISSVASLIKEKVTGLQTLRTKLLECQQYLESCIQSSESGNGSAKVNPDIIANLQTIVSLLPNLNTNDLILSIMKQSNDMYMAIYLASLIRTIMALHDLVNNKIRYGADGMYDIEEEMEIKEIAANPTNGEEKKE